MSLDYIRLTQQAKEQLIRLKRHTGLQHWNELCRWALCVSVAEPTAPPQLRAITDSSVEMNWKVFAGNYSAAYKAILLIRCKRDGLPIDDATLAEQLKLHLHRGIATLFSDRAARDIAALTARTQRISEVHPH